MDKTDRTRPPAWAREELILALDLYFKAGRRWLPSRDDAVGELSDLLNTLDIHECRGDPGRFRNRSGVAMKLANFLSLDPEYTGGGRSGLTRAGHLDKVLWDEFAADPARLHDVARGIRATAGEVLSRPDLEDDEEAEYAEGRYAYRAHRRRERNPRLRERKRQQALVNGAYRCEACGLAPLDVYGPAGHHVLECHHLVPLSEYRENQKTRLVDIALVCATCHRVLHAPEHRRGVEGIREMLASQADPAAGEAGRSRRDTHE